MPGLTSHRVQNSEHARLGQFSILWTFFLWLIYEQSYHHESEPMSTTFV